YCKVDKHTRFYISLGVNVQIAPASCHTTFHHRAVIPEVHYKDGFCLSKVKYMPSHGISLAGGAHKVHIVILSHRDEHEEPAVHGAFFNHQINKGFINKCVHVISRVCCRKPKYSTCFSQMIHGSHDCFESA